MSGWLAPLIGGAKVLKLFGVDYRLYYIVVAEADGVTPLPANIRFHRDEAGERTHVEYWVAGDERAASYMAIWYGEFQRRREYFVIPDDEAECAILATRPDRRKLGYGAVVLEAIPIVAHAIGLKRVWARVWHSNAASLKTFARAGWGPPGLRLDLLWRGRRMVLTLRHARARALS